MLPSQEIEQINQEYIIAKNVKVGSSAVTEQSHMNPDTSHGARVLVEICAKARVVQKSKLLKQQQKEATKTTNAQKMAEQAQKIKCIQLYCCNHQI